MALGIGITGYMVSYTGLTVLPIFVLMLMEVVMRYGVRMVKYTEQVSLLYLSLAVMEDGLRCGIRTGSYIE
jgi:hypothetical protein